MFLDGNAFHIECLWFCFNKVIQQDLDFVKLHWNTHHILPSRHDTTPGKPDELFFLQEHSGCEDQLIPILQAQVDDVVSQYDFANAAVENDYQEYFKYVCDLQGLSEPKNWHEALDLFHIL